MSLRFGFVKARKFLVETMHETVLSKQLLRSGISVAANVREALQSESKPDFIHKLSISLKEAEESSFWLELLLKSDYISQESYDSIQVDCVEVIKLLTSIIKRTKERMKSIVNYKSQLSIKER